MVKLLKSEFGANLVDAFDALMLPPSVQDARTLHEAMKVRKFTFNFISQCLLARFHFDFHQMATEV